VLRKEGPDQATKPSKIPVVLSVAPVMFALQILESSQTLLTVLKREAQNIQRKQRHQTSSPGL
jgi:hypothetical protein